MALPSVSITHHGGRSTHTKHTLDSHRRTHTELSVAATVSMFPPTSFLPTPLPRSPSSLLHLHSHLALFIFHTGAGVTFGVSHFNHSLLLSSLSSHLSKSIDLENTFCKEVLQSLTELFPLPSIPDLAFTFPPLPCLLFSFLFPLKSLVFFIPSARDHILPSSKCLPSSPKNISPISCCVAE